MPSGPSAMINRYPDAASPLVRFSSTSSRAIPVSAGLNTPLARTSCSTPMASAGLISVRNGSAGSAMLSGLLPRRGQNPTDAQHQAVARDIAKLHGRRSVIVVGSENRAEAVIHLQPENGIQQPILACEQLPGKTRSITRHSRAARVGKIGRYLGRTGARADDPVQAILVRNLIRHIGQNDGLGCGAGRHVI